MLEIVLTYLVHVQRDCNIYLRAMFIWHITRLQMIDVIQNSWASFSIYVSCFFFWIWALSRLRTFNNVWELSRICNYDCQSNFKNSCQKHIYISRKGHSLETTKHIWNLSMFHFQSHASVEIKPLIIITCLHISSLCFNDGFVILLARSFLYSKMKMQISHQPQCFHVSITLDWFAHRKSKWEKYLSLNRRIHLR